MLDEKALRKEGFAEGVPVRLCDGQVWHFARPVLSGFRFTKGEDGKTLLGNAHAPEFDRLLDACFEAETFAEEAVSLFDLGFHLLAQNYTVSFSDASCHLLRRSLAAAPDREANDAMWAEITGVALGQAPKATPPG